MKLVPKKDWQEKAAKAATHKEFADKVAAMIADPKTAAPLEVPEGFFTSPQNQNLKTKWADNFDFVEAPTPAKAPAAKTP